MMSHDPSRPERWRRGTVGMYALTLMEKEGAVHGYRVAERIAERTEGTWRPGPGAVYPALQRLTERGLARRKSHSLSRRREFEITPRGRAVLDRVRAFRGANRARAPDLAALWAEIAGVGEIEDLLLLRLQRSLGGLERVLSQPGIPRERRQRAKLLFGGELQRFLGGLPDLGEPSRRDRRGASPRDL